MMIQNLDKNILLSTNHTPPTNLLLVPSNQSIKIEKQFANSIKQGIHHSTSINLSR